MPTFYCSALGPPGRIPTPDFEGAERHPFPKIKPFVPGKETPAACEVLGRFVCTGKLREDARKGSVAP